MPPRRGWFNTLAASRSQSASIPPAASSSEATPAIKAGSPRIDRCDGHIVKDILFPPPEGKTSARVLAIVVTDTEIHVAGDVDKTNGGLYGTFDKGLKKLTLTAYPGSGLSSLSRIARTKDGSVWLGGGRESWILRTMAGSSASGARRATAGTAVAGIVPTDTGKLVALIESGEVARLAEVSADCVLKELPTPLAVAEQGPPNYLTAVGDTFYAVGSAGGANRSNYGYLAARSATSDWTVAAPLDPNPQFADRLLRIESDGAGLFAGGSQNESLSGGTPAVYRYNLPLTDKSAPVWNTVPFGAHLFNIEDLKLAPTGDDSLFVAGAPRPDPTNGAIARCRKSTGCDAK